MLNIKETCATCKHRKYAKYSPDDIEGFCFCFNHDSKYSNTQVFCNGYCEHYERKEMNCDIS